MKILLAEKSWGKGGGTSSEKYTLYIVTYNTEIFLNWVYIIKFEHGFHGFCQITCMRAGGLGVKDKHVSRYGGAGKKILFCQKCHKRE